MTAAMLTSMATATDSVRESAHVRIDLFDEAHVAEADAWHRSRARKHLRRAPHVREHRDLNGPELLEWAVEHRNDTEAEQSGLLVQQEDANILTRIGLLRYNQRLAAIASNQGLDATHARIGVGNGTTAVPTPSSANTDTDLSASSGSGNRQFKLVDSVAVGSGATAGVLTFVATFTTAMANFTWSEWGIDGGTADGTTVTADTNTTPGLINRKVPGTALLTKSNTVTAVFTATLTLS